MTQAWATSRWDRPCSYLSRRISRIFLTRSLRVGIASPSVQKAKDPAVRLPMSAHDPGNWVIQFGRKRSTSAEIGDPLRPKQVIHFRRNRRSTSSEIRNIRPVAVDQVHVHLAADQRAQVLRDARAVEHMAAFGRQVADARDERVAEERARGEDMVEAKTNPDSETADVRFVKGDVASAVRARFARLPVRSAPPGFRSPRSPAASATARRFPPLRPEPFR